MDNDTVDLFKNLVYSIAKKYSFNDDTLEDLYQVGMIGLHHALDNYKEESMAKFSTYAHFYIRGEILKYIRENRTIRRNYEIDKLIRSIGKVKEHLTQIKEREPTLDEIAEYLSISVSDVARAINLSLSVKSMDYEFDLENDMCLYDSEAYIEKGYDENILMLREELEKLPEDERKIIDLRYYKDRSQMETSKELGMSQVQVSRKENKILAKIRNNIAA